MKFSLLPMTFLAIIISVGLYVIISTPQQSFQAASQSNIRQTILDKTPQERSQTKVAALLQKKVVGLKENTRYGLTFEIESISKITSPSGVDGVEVFARAWKSGRPIGFGDGTVEVERFRIWNPPLLIDDPQGDVLVTFMMDGEEQTLRYREDIEAALYEALAHTISVTAKDGSNIQPGKRGRTTDTFYPSFDAYAQRNNNGSPYESWSTLRAGAGTDSSGTNAAIAGHLISHGNTSTNWVQIIRGYFHFDTSSLTGATISAATISFVGSTKSNDANFSSTSDLDLHVVAASTASDTAIANSDYGNISATSFGSKSYDTFNVDGSTYNDITLDSNGIANINLAGISKFGTRAAADLSDTNPSASVETNSRIYIKHSETAGTSADPALIVTYTSGGGEAESKIPAFQINNGAIKINNGALIVN